jgi:fermentation-respiration switch protein FrsA (DUF1100 family)
MLLQRIVSSFIYYPDPHWYLTPADLGLEAEEVRIVPEPGIELHAWFFPHQRPFDGPQGRPREGLDAGPIATLLFCHGNAGNVSHRLENVHYLVQMGFQVLLFDYRGYGHSTGEPSEEGLYLDAAAAWAYLVQRGDTVGAPQIIFGRSLGGAVAVELATRVATSGLDSPDGLVIESTFTSIRTLARHMFASPLPELPVKYNSLGKIDRIGTPLLAIHGERDELIPYADGLALFEAAPEPKAWYPIRGAGHNDTYVIGGEAYFGRLAAFAAELPDREE